MEFKRIVKMGDKKVIIVPKKSKFDVGEWIMFDNPDDIKKFIKTKDEKKED